MTNPLDEISVYIDWQFETPAPEGKEEFFNAVKKYQSEIASEMPWYMKLYQSFIRTNLDKNLGIKKLAIIYSYATEELDGEWTDHEEELLLENQAGVTAGDILYSLHHKSHGKLHNQDIMALEGLELVESSDSQEHPTYHVFFGS